MPKLYYATSITCQARFHQLHQTPQNTIPDSLDKTVSNKVKENRQLVRRMAEALLLRGR